MALVPQSHKDFDHNENNFIYSKATRLTEKKNSEKWKLQLKIVKTPLFSDRFKVLEIFSFTVLFYALITMLTLQSHLW